jgi:hypothetical protein
VALSAIVVEITSNVVRIRRLLEIRLVALVAVCIRQLIVAAGVTWLALRSNVRSGQRKLGCVMVERRRCPIRRWVALRAIMVEIAGNVIRVRRLLEISLMALVTVCIHQLIVATNVTWLALRGNVRSGQRKLGCVMVERRRCPIRRWVALRAIVVEITGNVIRVRRLLEIRLVALIAVRIRQLIVAARVTRLALSRNMRPSQRKLGCIVIECCSRPIRCCVTLRAIMVEIAGNVIRVRRLLEISLVALIAIRISQLVIAAGMAWLTLRGNVCTRQREQGGVVIERCRCPIGSRMTLRTIMVEVPSNVIRIRCLLEIHLMAGETGHGLPGKHIVAVATRALLGDVCTS